MTRYTRPVHFLQPRIKNWKINNIRVIHDGVSTLQLVDLVEPVDPQDAATKFYVDPSYRYITVNDSLTISDKVVGLGTGRSILRAAHG